MAKHTKAKSGAASAVDKWFQSAKPAKAVRCQTCRSWPDVVAATARFLELRAEAGKELSLRQFHREVLQTQFGFTVTYGTWSNHVRECVGVKD